MRLINVQTGLLEEFLGEEIPEYAILSHTWEDEEVSFQDMKDERRKRKKGDRKISMTCNIAAEYDVQYVWIDTCCIDKSSSSELSEAINSMYRWYQGACVCYVWLSDLPASADLGVTLGQCRWFTRGWTLQELIAPSVVLFFDQQWMNIGTKISLSSYISYIAKIDEKLLQTAQPDLSSIPVAHKMSWAAYRRTTRVEDMAYCLLGIFDINMPLLYGEADKAFQRLQEEIVRKTVDFTIFAWKLPPLERLSTNIVARTSPRTYCGILAPTPAFFAECAKYRPVQKPRHEELSITSLGLKTKNKLLMIPVRKFGERKGYRYILPLNCTSSSPNVFLGVHLRKCGQSQYIREDPWSLYEYSRRTIFNSSRPRYLLTDVPKAPIHRFCPGGDASLIPRMRSHVLQVTLPKVMHVTDVWPWDRFDHEDQVFFVGGDRRLDSQDFGAVRLTLYSTLTIDGREIEILHDFFFYAVGWSSPLAEDIQCSILDGYLYNDTIKDMQSILRGWDPETNQFVRRLVEYRIPKIPATVFPIPGTDYHVVITFDIKRVGDVSVCFSDFWDVYFKCTVFSSTDLPSIAEEAWVIPTKMEDNFYSALLPEKHLPRVGVYHFT